MEKNEIKKALYRQKPKANMLFLNSEVIYYETYLEDQTRLTFEVAIEDLGDAKFEPVMDAKLLIRWLIH